MWLENTAEAASPGRSNKPRGHQEVKATRTFARNSQTRFPAISSAVPAPAPATLLPRTLDDTRLSDDDMEPEQGPSSPRLTGSQSMPSLRSASARHATEFASASSSTSGRRPVEFPSAASATGRRQVEFPSAVANGRHPIDFPSTVVVELRESDLAIPKSHARRRKRPPKRNSMRLSVLQKMSLGRKRQSMVDDLAQDGVDDMLAQGGEELDEETLAASKAFESRHRKLTQSASALLERCRTHEYAAGLTKKFEHAVTEVRRNRFFMDTKAEAGPVEIEQKGKRRVRKKWKLEDSHVWKGRGRGKYFWETADSMRRMFDLDWEVAKRSHNLDALIIKTKMGEQAGQRGAMVTKHDAMGIGEDEVTDVYDGLWAYHRAIYGCFEYFCARFSSEGPDWSSVDPFNLSFNAFHCFLRECGMSNKACPVRELETIWSAVTSIKRDGGDKFACARSISRQDFIEVLVRIAIIKYVRTGRMNDISNAVEQTCRDMTSKLPALATHNSNIFRSRFCYLKEVEAVLAAHMPTIRSVFDVYSNSNDDVSNVMSKGGVIDVSEWLLFVGHIGLFDASMISVFFAKLTFLWSRLRALDDWSQQSRVRLRSLSFQDFNEALVRLATLIPLPTDEDLNETGAKDAGELMSSLQFASPGEFAAFREERAQHHDWRLEHPRQKIWRCVHHLLTYIECVIISTTRQTDSATDAATRPTVERKDVSSFLKQRQSGAPLVLTNTMSAPSFRNVLMAARRRLIGALRSVALFQSLTDEQIETMHETMCDAVYEKGEVIFEQDEAGDCFFVLSEGGAEVTRFMDERARLETTLAVLGPGACFGERALLHDDVRFATVTALTRIKTRILRRDQLEAALGAPMQALIPDAY